MSIKLFDPTVPGYHSAQIGGVHRRGWHVATSFLRAADTLVDSAMEPRGLPPDLAFLPICLLYRHAAEVTFKELIRDTEKLVRLHVQLGEVDLTQERESDAVDKKVLSMSHRLHDLLAHFEERMALVTDERLPQEHRGTLVELAQFDETGERFRYATMKVGKPKDGVTKPSFDEEGYYDIERLRTRLGEAIDFLHGGVAGWLSHHTDLALEVLAFQHDVMNE